MAKKIGRPGIEIDKDQFEKLCFMQCTLTELANFFQCSEDTILRWCKRTYNSTFAEVFKKYSAGGKMSLRRKQFTVAVNGKGNVSMLIWLGKQYLGQKDFDDTVTNLEKLAHTTKMKTEIEKIKAELEKIKGPNSGEVVPIIDDIPETKEGD